MDIARADASVTLTLPISTALDVMAGIRRMHDGWLKNLTPEEANRRVEPDIHAARNLPNHIARALQELRGQLDAAAVESPVPMRVALSTD